MNSETGRAAKARELAQWFRAMAPDVDGLMARAAEALEDVADDETQDAVPEIAPVQVIVLPQRRPAAINDNARLVRRRTRQ